MKIGVVTYWYGNSNYGMILQCWALQQYLKKMGHDPYVIRFKPQRPWYIRFAKSIIRDIRCVVSKSIREENNKKRQSMLYNSKKDCERAFESFRERHLVFSEKYYNHICELRSNPPAGDCYIAGSDQIWGSAPRDDFWGYYLAFGRPGIKKIAYAPSFGKESYPEDKLPILSKALSYFDYISCRENAGVRICQCAGYNATKVVDPTLLLSKEDYLQLCGSTHYTDYIFIYSVNMGNSEDIFWSSLKSYFPEKKVVVTPASGSIESGELFGNDVDYCYATPGMWLSLINNSSLVVTSSFHGVVISIILNKNFAFVPIKGAHSASNNRITELLEELKLTDRIVHTPDDYLRLEGHPIEWKYINEKKEYLTKQSVRFLEDALMSAK